MILIRYHIVMKKRLLLLPLLFTGLQATNYDALLFHGNCTTCHFETESVSAPSMMIVRERYRSAFPNKADFVDYMANWVLVPDEKSSLMHDAIEKYELMPELAFDLETLKSISGYIYDTDFNQRHKGHKADTDRVSGSSLN